MVIQNFVKPGSTIHTDCWAAYSSLANLEDYQYTHNTVNHSVNFVAPDGTHTNTIEGKITSFSLKF